jgi:IS605 OrfB family transposase
MITYSIRLFPNQEQISQLQNLSDIRMDIWNTLIDIQQKEYETNKKILNKFQLYNQIPILKHSIKPNWNDFNSKAAQTVATEIFQSYQSFFTLIKKDKTARPPRKRDNPIFFHTLNFNQSGWSIKNDKFIINQIPFYYKTKVTNLSELNIKEIRVKFKNEKWLCDIIVDNKNEYKDTLSVNATVLAIDLGIKNLGYCVDNKGNVIVIRNKSKKINKYFSKQINNVKSKLSKKEKGSKSYIKLNNTKSKLYSKKNNQIKQTLHIQSKKLVNMNYNTIVIGDLTVKSLMSTTGVNKNKKSLRKSFDESNINMFLQFLKYKSQFKQNNITKIDEKYTTQLNSLTGKMLPEKVELNQRTVKLNDNVIIDRDLNAAINIMKRYYDNHLASMTEPLDYSNVIMNFNVCNNQSLNGKFIIV